MSEKLKIMYFSAPWCGPCRAFGPAFDEVVAKFGNDIDVHKINIDEDIAIARKFEIVSIPTVVLSKGGDVLFRHRGVMPKNHLEDLIKVNK